MQAAEPNTVTGATAMEVVCDMICCAPAAREMLVKDFHTFKELEDCVNSITGPVSVKVQGLRACTNSSSARLPPSSASLRSMVNSQLESFGTPARRQCMMQLLVSHMSLPTVFDQVASKPGI